MSDIKKKLQEKLNKKNDLGKKSVVSSQLSVSDTYKQMSHLEHIKQKSDTYIGSKELEETEQYLLDDSDPENIKFVKKTFKFCPGLFKCFDELIVNAFDHSKRQHSKILEELKVLGKEISIPVTNIKVNIDREKGEIVVYNDGDGIDIEMIPEHGIYPAELIFARLLSSANYDDDQERTWGGKNGYGAKLANIFSTSMTIETVDAKRKKKYIQVFSDNMSKISKPIITKYSGKPYTKITWLPDLSAFNLKHLDKIHESIMKTRVYDISACTEKSINVHLNGTKIQEKTFEKYVNLYIGDKHTRDRVCCEVSGWKLVVSYNDNEIFEQVSFVNGIKTIRGGKHVDYIVDQIKNKLCKVINKKKKLNTKPAYIKNQLMVFLYATVINPSFDSQTKETLKTNRNKFGYDMELTDKFIEKLFKTPITDKIVQLTSYKDNKDSSKTDGRKVGYVKVAKLSDAKHAGGKKSKQCTLILTEGDSAKSMAVAGVSEVGRDDYGIFPLRGKVLNVRDSQIDEINKNIEIANIKKILGLQSGKTWTKEELEKDWPLRYGKVMIMTDQDLDGSHIKGLVMNLFDHIWPILLEVGFLCSMITPIIKVKKKKIQIPFYTIQDYNKWVKKGDKKGWTVKYYKGLGTSTTAEAKEYFKNMKVVNYCHEEDDSKDESKDESKDTELVLNDFNHSKLDLAFRKDRADDRKVWLTNYDEENISDFTNNKQTFNNFVDKELIHYSNYDNYRSIPDIRDGFKPSTRKIIYSCFLRNLVKEIKVAQLAGYVSEHAAYHHGEKSLEGAIVGLAQKFVGSGNINLLNPGGQFGTRLLGGKDAAQSRYIFTHLTKAARIIFNKHDEPIYKRMEDDGQMVEPEAYCGILPMILVNGGLGIGTGWSTRIPCYNPIDLIKLINQKLSGKEYSEIMPWYRGFIGSIHKIDERNYISKGVYNIINSTTVQITELPIESWTEKYLEYLDKCVVERGKDTSKKFIKRFVDNSTESKINIVVTFDKNVLKKLLNQQSDGDINELEKVLKLTSKISTGNMWLFNVERKIKKYKSIYEILDEWIQYRLELYIIRKANLLKTLKNELDIISQRVKFILEIIEETIDIRNKAKKDIINELKEKQYSEFSLNLNSIPSYDYILKMDLYKLTKEEIDTLKNQKLKKETEVNQLESMTVNTMWNEELTELTKNINN